MLKKFACSSLFTFVFCCGGIASASDSDLSATPDYSYDSYKSKDTYSLNRDMSSSLSKHNSSGSSRSFSGPVMIYRSHSQSGYSPQRSGYSPQASGYNPQPANSTNTNNPQRGSNSAYYKTNTYNY